MRGKCLSGHLGSGAARARGGHGVQDGKVLRSPSIFQLKWPSMWFSDWAEILFGNVSRVEERPLKILHNLHAQFEICFRTVGASWARHARSRDI